MGRSELKNLKRTTLNSFLEVCREQGLRAGVHYRLNHQDSIIYFPANGSEIVMADLAAYPSDPEFDSLGSLEITGAFIDEASQITEKAKNIVKSRIRYRLNECRRIPKLLMCGNPSKNWSYYEFYMPSMDGSLREDRQFVPALPGDNRHLPESYIESLKGLDKNSMERLLNGNWNFDSDPSAMIDYDNILNCFTNNLVKDGERYITCDVARFGSDKTVLGVWSGYRVKLFSYHGLSVRETASKIQELRAKYNIDMSRIIADEDGVGGGVVDILRCKGFVNNSRPVNNSLTGEPENFANLKSQCYWKLAERINSHGLYIDCDDINMRADIIQELEQVKQYQMDRDGKRGVLPKDKVKEIIGRSPDYSDTLMFREWFDLKPRFEVVAF